MEIKPKILLNLFLLLFLIISLGANQFILGEINERLGIKFGSLNFSWLASNASAYNLSGNIGEDAVKLALSEGMPDIYGQEMNVSFDQVQAAINVMKRYDPTYGQNKIILGGDALKRFIDVGLKISCEYCCGAASIIRSNGDAACGCAHSQAMRGLLAYLIQNHGNEYSNDELLRELARWKAMYFPKQMIQKLTTQLQGAAAFTPDTASLILGVELPEYSEGSGEIPLPSELENLPGMVGGC